MAPTTLATFACESCGKQYTWKPELAGRAVKCRCGALMRAPAAPPSPDETLYDLTDQPTPAPEAAAPPSPTPSAAPRPAPASVLQYARKPQAPTGQFDTEKLKNIQAPIALTAAGLVVLCISTCLQAGTTGLILALAAMGIQLIISTTLMLAAVFIVARQRGIQVGPLGSAILKLLAVALAPAAVMSILALALQFIPLGWVANGLIGFCLYFALLGLFFDLDQEDTWYCVMIIFLINVAVALGVKYWF